MLETSARLLRLLSLFQARRYWSGAELVDRLEVTSRTLRRDVDRLRHLGYPVHSSSGTSGGYQLGAGATLPPLLLDDDEAVAVAVGLRTAASGGVTGIEESSVRALAKLEQVMPSRLRRRISALHSFIVPVTNGGPRVEAATLSLIAGACRDYDGLRFGYRGKNGAPSARQVEPHRLVNFGRRWYLVAWDAGRTDWRTFRVDRIDKPALSGLRFLPRKLPAEDIAAYVTRGIAYEQYPYRATVILHASAERMAEFVSCSLGTLEGIDAGRCRVHIGAYSIGMLAGYLAMFGVDFEVTEPPELIEEVRRLSARFSQAANPETH
ncbi:MAG TPA: YafY family protein [Silvibacterium sp.]|jgi:predicted DNA-binding transcriptional regulator YafY|nr:YafY family protein [Silvibacterium sp.]